MPLAVLFTVITVAFAAIAVWSAEASRWPIAAAAGGARGLDGVPCLVRTEENARPRAYSPSVAGEDTQALWIEFRRTNDKALRDRLILTYAPLVKYVAGRLGSGLPAHVDEGDLVSYGLLGLIGAIERYDPGSGHQVRDLRDRADQGRDHRRAARARLGAAVSVGRGRARSSGRSPSSRRSSAPRRPTSRSRRRSGSRSRSSRTRSPTSPARRSPPSTSCGRSRATATRSR